MPCCLRRMAIPRPEKPLPMIAMRWCSLMVPCSLVFALLCGNITHKTNGDTSDSQRRPQGPAGGARAADARRGAEGVRAARLPRRLDGGDRRGRGRDEADG